MPVISNQNDQPGKNPAAVALGRLGGKAGVGAAKRRPKTRADIAKMVAAKKEKRDTALEVLGALIECEKAISSLTDGYPLVTGEQVASLVRAEQRAALAIARAAGAKPGTKGQIWKR